MHSLKKNVKVIIGSKFGLLLPLLDYKEELKIIFTYHRVVEELPEELHDPAMFVTVNTFEMNISQISKRFDIVPLETLIRYNGKKGRLCSITLDDGWKDNYDYAFPILRRQKLPATIFIPMNMIGSGKKYWFQSLWELAAKARRENRQAEFIEYFAEYAPASGLNTVNVDQVCRLLGKLKYYSVKELDGIIQPAPAAVGVEMEYFRDILNWDEIRLMSHHDITFGSHGLDHAILTRMNSESKRKEICASLEMLRNTGISISPVFSYPGGYFDDETLSLVKEAGYLGAVTGIQREKEYPYCINRIDIHEDNSNLPSLLWFRVFQATIHGA